MTSLIDQVTKDYMEYSKATSFSEVKSELERHGILEHIEKYPLPAVVVFPIV